MAEGDFQAEFAKSLDCHICMERLENPKVLSCQHSFCKNCLDDMINFRGDGHGIIRCPLRCEEVTLIAAEKTTNDLPVPYQLKSILDTFNKQSIRHQSSLKKLQCSGKNQCSNDTTRYCLVCKVLLCQPCKDRHADNHNIISVKFDRQTEQTKAVCDKHKTFANFHCCDGIICIYCKERDHNLHQVETIKEQVKKIKEVLLHPDYGVGRIEDLIENTFKNVGSTELSICMLQHMLQKALNNRRSKLLYQYLTFWKKEEERMVEELNIVVNNQMQQYPKTKSTDFYKDILQSNDFEIIFHKETIVNNIAEFTKNIPLLKIGLSDGTCSQPLGNLKVEHAEFVSINDQRTPASILQSFSGTDTMDVSFTSLDKLRSLVDEVLPRKDAIGDHQPNIELSLEKPTSSDQVLPRKDAIVDHQPHIELSLEKPTSSDQVLPSKEAIVDHQPHIELSREKPTSSDQDVTHHSALRNCEILKSKPEKKISKKRKQSLKNSTRKPFEPILVDPSAIEISTLSTKRTPNHTNVSSKSIVTPAERMREKLQKSNISKSEVAVSGTSSPSSYDQEKLQSALWETNQRGIDYIRDLCTTKKEELIILLLDLCPAIISMTNSIGNTPFHFAALNGCSKVLSRLLRMNPYAIDNTNQLGSTPLHYAVENRHSNCIEVLFSWNCDRNIENCMQCTPMKISQKYKYEEIISLFEKNQQDN